MSSLLDQSLQIALQETTAIGVFAVLAVGVLGLSIRSLVGSGSAREGSEQPSDPTSEEGTHRIVSDGGSRPRNVDADEEEFEQRLDTLESEVDNLSSTVESVQTENEEIAENVEEVNGNLKRLLDLSGNLARGINPFSSHEEEPEDTFQEEPEDTFQEEPEDTFQEEPEDTFQEEPEDAFQRNARREANPDVNHTKGEPVNRHEPVQHDKVETLPGGTGAAEEFDRMEEEVEELDTLSFSDDVEGGFGERVEEDLGTEEVIAGSEPAPTGDAIGDGGTLIETKEEELDIEPGSVSEPASPTESTESPDTETQPEVESGFEFGAKALESEPAEPVAEDSSEPAPENPGETEDAQADEPTVLPTEEVEAAGFEESSGSEKVVSGVEDPAKAETDSTPLDEQTEAELAAAEAAFAAEFDAEDELSLDIDLSEEPPEPHDETGDTNEPVQTAPSADEAVEEPPATEPAAADSMKPTADADLTEPTADADLTTEGPHASATTDNAETLSLAAEMKSTDERQTEKPTRVDAEPSMSEASARSLAEHISVTEGGKPYIESLPDGYSAELLVVEWLESLVDDIGVHGTARAIQYYESLEWITADVADQLDAYLYAFESGDADTLGVDQHLRSLEYVDELARSEDDE
jgi:archaellum component FlaD/FlaE